MQQISDFIDFIVRNYQAKTVNPLLEGDRSKAWARWFESTDSLEITPVAPTNEYQQRLLDNIGNKDSVCDSLRRWGAAVPC